MTIPDPFLDTASQRQATGMDVGARKLVLKVVANVADPSLTLYYLFAGRFGDIDDYVDAVEEVWGHAVAQELRDTAGRASEDAIARFLVLTPSGGQRVEIEVATQLLLHMPEPDFRQAAWKTARGTLRAEALAPHLTEVCRNRGIPWEFDSEEGFRWIGDHEVETHAVRPALSAVEDPRFAGGVKSEFDSARSELGLGTPTALKQAVFEAGSAVESAMKVLLGNRDLEYGERDTASPLFDRLVDGGIVPRLMEKLVLSAATARNKRAGHGAGAIPHDVPPEMAEAVVASASVAISYPQAQLRD
jgi:hypothetical protein